LLHQLPQRPRLAAAQNVGDPGLVHLHDVRRVARALSHLDIVGHDFVVRPLEERHHAIVLLRGVVPPDQAVELGPERAAHAVPETNLLRRGSEPRSAQ
jgi:hypothetical protein